jgi:hypothetical protein
MRGITNQTAKFPKYPIPDPFAVGISRRLYWNFNLIIALRELNDLAPAKRIP